MGSAAISACEKGGKWLKALELLSAMMQDKVEVNTITYNAAISACGQDGEWEWAIQVFAAMSQCSVLPDTISYNALLESLDEHCVGQPIFLAALDAGHYAFLYASNRTLDLHGC